MKQITLQLTAVAVGVLAGLAFSGVALAVCDGKGASGNTGACDSPALCSGLTTESSCNSAGEGSLIYEVNEDFPNKDGLSPNREEL